jgi:hypothetical protein
MSWLTLRRSSKASTSGAKEKEDDSPPSLPPLSHSLHNPSRRDSSEYELINRNNVAVPLAALVPKTENDALSDVKRLEVENNILKSQLQALRSESNRNGVTEHYIFSSRATASDAQGDQIVASSNDPSVSTRTQQRKSFLDAMITADADSATTTTQSQVTKKDEGQSGQDLDSSTASLLADEEEKGLVGEVRWWSVV